MTAARRRAAKPRRSYPEAALQRAVVQYLKIFGSPGMLFFKIANEGQRSARQGYEMKLQGLHPGAADLCICMGGRAYFLELKAAKQKPTEVQLQFAADCLDAGCDYAWADNIEDALKLLKRWGALGRSGAK